MNTQLANEIANDVANVLGKTINKVEVKETEHNPKWLWVVITINEDFPYEKFSSSVTLVNKALKKYDNMFKSICMWDADHDKILIDVLEH